jgi:DinB superfamily
MPVKDRTKDAVSEIEAGLRGLEEMAKLDTKTLARRYAPGKWNGLELFAHVADADLVYFYRFLKVIAEEGAPIVPFDQDKWVIELRASERPVDVSLAASRGARAGFVHYLKTLPPQVLERKTVHPERGPVTAFDIAARIGTHALHHIKQLEAIRDGKTWAAKN